MYKSKRLFNIWNNMKARCTNPNNPSYRWYGGNGIRMTSSWMNYEAFEEWALNNGYKDNLTIDRIDNDDGYYPGNCRFITLKKNMNNKSNCVFVKIDGETKTLTEWAEFKGLKQATVIQRYRRGKRGKELISPVNEVI